MLFIFIISIFNILFLFVIIMTGEFTIHAPPFYDSNHVWIAAGKQIYNAHLWHKWYSMHTKVLFKVVCRVCSKVLGIGGAKRRRKKMKKNMAR